MAVRHRVFRFPRSLAWELACRQVEDWINANVPASDVINVMMEDNEQGGGADVIVVWYRVPTQESPNPQGGS